MELIGRNVNSVWPQALRAIKDSGVKRTSRNGPVREVKEPVTTVYECPWERVLFDDLRDANPFFHLFEALWILAGRDDVAFPAQFCERLKDYSDDGQTFYGAYGARLRNVKDQLLEAVAILRAEPDSRRAVLQIWDATKDLGHDGKDIPCNTQLYLKLRDGALHLTVCNRSNDIVWGLYGANAVQWSMVQEYLAAQLGVAMGPMTTLSDSFHIYESNRVWQAIEPMKSIPALADPYESRYVCAYPLVDVPGTFDAELDRHLKDQADELAPMFPNRSAWRNSFFWCVAEPLYKAWQAHKQDKSGARFAAECQATDWRHAALKWLARRGDKLTKAEERKLYAEL